MKKFPEFYNLKKLEIFQNVLIWNTIEIQQFSNFWNCLSIRYSALLAILPILIFANT